MNRKKEKKLIIHKRTEKGKRAKGGEEGEEGEGEEGAGRRGKGRGCGVKKRISSSHNQVGIIWEEGK
jgi:hypothetical protein